MDLLISPGKENRRPFIASTPLSWDATPSPCNSTATLTLDYNASPFLAINRTTILKERNRATQPQLRGTTSPFGDSSFSTPELKIPKPRRATPKPTFAAVSYDEEEDEDEDTGEAFSYEEAYSVDEDDDADGEIAGFEEESEREDSVGDHYEEEEIVRTYSSSLPSSLPSSSSSPAANSPYSVELKAMEARMGRTPASDFRLSSTFSTPLSFSTPPIPDTKTTPFLRLKRDPQARNLLKSSALTSFVAGDSAQTPLARGATPGRSARSRFQTPPMPSPARTTPFFVSKVRAKDRLKTPQAKPLWTRADSLHFDDDSYDYDEDLEEAELETTQRLAAVLRTPPLPSPTRTITFKTPYANKSQPRSNSDGHAVGQQGDAQARFDYAEAESDQQQQTPTNKTVAVLRQLPPSPDFPSPPATTMFLYYRPAESEEEVGQAGANPKGRREHQQCVLPRAPVKEEKEEKKEKEKSLDSSSSTLNMSEFEREKERLERELEQEMLKAVNAQASPASLPPTSTFNFDAQRTHSPYFAQKFSFSASMMVEETCKVIPTNALLKYESEESAESVESLDGDDDPSSMVLKDPRGRMTDDTITLDVGTVLLTAKIPVLTITAPIAANETATEAEDERQPEAEATTNFTGGRFTALIQEFQATSRKGHTAVATENISLALAAQQKHQRSQKQMRRPASVPTFTQIKTEEKDAPVAEEEPPFPFHLFPAAMQEGVWKQRLPRLYSHLIDNRRTNGNSLLSLDDLKTRLPDVGGEAICLALHVLVSKGLVQTTLEEDKIGWRL